MASDLRFAYLVPVHNEAKILESTVSALIQYLRNYPGSRIILIENASQDNSKALIDRIVTKNHEVKIHGLSLAEKGLGRAYHTGVREVLSWNEPYWIVFGAADLPFEFSDIASFISALQKKPSIRVATGSKLHPESCVQRTLMRRFLTWSYWQLRKHLLHMTTRDCQGSAIVHTQAMRFLAPLITSTDYFFTTELIYFAEELGLQVEEVPVRFAGEKRPSTVRPCHHGWEMFWHIVALRKQASSATLPLMEQPHATT